MRARLLLLVGALGGCAGAPEPPRCGAELTFTDLSDRSPDLAAAPYGGSPGWDHVDKYGPGLGLGDLDGDGVLDLVLARADRDEPGLRTPRVFRGLGDGRFEHAASPPWDPAFGGGGVLLFDRDGDGDLDVWIGVDGGDPVLYDNRGGFALVDVSAAAGLTGHVDRALTAAAGDVDGDGDLDLYLGQWRADEPEHGAGLAPNLLLLNDGSGAFAPAEAEVACGGRATLGQALADLDGDGDLDLYVANDFFADCLYEDLGGGAFRDVSAAAGIEDGAARGMGVALGDLDEDGTLDLLVTDTQEGDASPGNAAYVQDPARPLGFRSRAGALGLDGLSVLASGWMVCWGAGVEDFDGDGHTEVHVATHGELPELVLRRAGEGFVPDWEAMDALGDVDARGSAYGDLDGDGDLDMVIARRGAGVQVWRNDADPPATIEVRFEPPALGIGAQVVLQAGGRRQLRAVQAGSSYWSSGPPVAHFGLCGAPRVSRVEALLPDGTRLVAEDLPPGTRRVTLRRGRTWSRRSPPSRPRPWS